MSRCVESVEARVVRVITEVLCAPPSLDASIIDDLQADSIDLFSLVAALEDEFDGSINEEDIDALATVRDVVAYIERAHAVAQ